MAEEQVYKNSQQQHEEIKEQGIIFDREERSSTSSTSSSASRIHWMPPEIWGKIFENLEDPNDLVEVSKSTPYFNNVLLSTRSSWLFHLTFPLLLDHISRDDVLQCRRVCKRWCYGVDHFLQNNAYMRPASEETRKNSDEFKTDLRLRPLMMSLYTRELLYIRLKQNKREVLLKEASNHPRCPLLGRSACIIEYIRSFPPPNAHILQMFGHHLWFIKIGIQNIPPVQLLTRILELIKHTPILKKLDIFGVIIPSRGPLDDDEFIEEDVEHQISKYMSSWFPEEEKQRLPKLETLDMEMTGVCEGKIKEIFLTLFGNENLGSLAVNLMPVSVTQNLNLTNLTDLSTTVDSDVQLQNLLLLQAPLRRLLLNLQGSNIIIASLLFEVACHFHETLRTFGFQISPEFYSSQHLDVDFPSKMIPFMNPESLNSLHVQRSSMKGCRPFSFNYLFGLRKSLKYLHIYMDNFERWDKVLEQQRSSIEVSTAVANQKELLDLLEILKQMNTSKSSNKLKIYESNLWKVFPRLKSVTVMLWNDGDTPFETNKVEWEYRRDVYEKIQHKTE